MSHPTTAPRDVLEQEYLKLERELDMIKSGMTCEDEGCPHYGTPHGHGKLPDGMVLVDAEPTKAMIDAAEKLDFENDGDVRTISVNIWQAMLQAAQRGDKP